MSTTLHRHRMFLLLLGATLVLADNPVEAQQDAEPGRQAPAQTAPARSGETPPPAGGAEGQPPADPADTGDGRPQAIETDGEAGRPLIAVPGGPALGMSILGNQEAPTSLVIVPWKTSELGTSIGISPMLDDSRQPVDRDVFMRALRYYEIRVTDTTR